MCGLSGWIERRRVVRSRCVVDALFEMEGEAAALEPQRKMKENDLPQPTSVARLTRAPDGVTRYSTRQYDLPSWALMP